MKRLPNKYGSVTKMKGNRRNPWRARKYVGEIEKDGRKQVVYEDIGYFPTQEDALRELSLKNDTLLVREGNITLGQCYELWQQEYELTKPMPMSYRTAYKYLAPLKNRPISELKAIDLESVINSDKIPRTVKYACVINLHGIYGYAMRHDIVVKDYSTVAKYAIDTKTQIQRKIFDTEEINLLWKNYKLYDKITLVLLYSGMRVSEICEIRKANVHLDEMYMVGGVKTEAGKNRIIPIHSTIFLLVKEFYDNAKGEWLFTKNGKKLAPRNIMYNIEQRGHYAHDTRHTFTTQAYKCGISEQDIKRIVGHKQTGVTQSTYIHLDYEYLCNEIEKLHY